MRGWTRRESVEALELLHLIEYRLYCIQALLAEEDALEDSPPPGGEVQAAVARLDTPKPPLMGSREKEEWVV